MYPSDLRYSNDHDWVRREGDGTVTSGITDWQAKQLGEIVMIELPQVGLDVARGEPLGTVESVKAVIELFAAVSAKVTALNDLLSHSPETVNDDPYGDGWILKLRPSDAAELDGLMTAAQYDAYVKEADA